jgi:thiol-disulfide isomerase/thioredoxin
VLGQAPEFRGNQDWFNTPGDRPLTLRSLRGRVVLVDFWTYSCINCIRTLPYLKAWDVRYRSAGLTIVGVHTPEFPFEKVASNVRAAIRQNALRYPVAQDNDDATWNAYGNEYWPAEYFIDARGRVRFTHFGEGDYGTKEKVIRTLLAEAGDSSLGPMTHARAISASPRLSTPESYLGAARAARFANGPILTGVRDFGAPRATLALDQLAYSGRWKITRDQATALSGAGLDLSFNARRVYLVLGAPEGPRSARLLLDGRPIPARFAGADVRADRVRVSSQRLYRLVDLPAVGRHRLRLEPGSGISAYAFTFG